MGSSAAPARPIIIKKKSGHAGHHGGAWKVAYADFVTAMMALFIVLWLLNSSKQIRVAVGGYFKDPTGHSKKVGNGMSGSGDNFIVTKENMDQIKEEIERSVRKIQTFEQFKDQIEMTVTSEGLRIEMMESDKGTFFPSGAPEPNGSGRELLVKLASELGKLPNQISIEGHTDATPYAGNAAYGNWELSADRANAARRLMAQSGLRAGQITQIRGYADQRLRKADKPADSSNRRISVIVQYMPKTDAQIEAEEKSAEAEEAKKGGGEHDGAQPGAQPAAVARHAPPTATPAPQPPQPAAVKAPAKH